MPRFKHFEPQGVIPACLLPFHDDLSIDALGYRKHLRDVAAVGGISALTVNAHASEVHACTHQEQERVLALTMDEVGDRLPVVNGVYADGSHLAARVAKAAERGGASCLLVFPPNSMAMGGQLRPEMALAHFRTIAEATDLPIILFQYPLATGLNYPFETLLQLAAEVPQIRAIKDWCADPSLHERNIRTLQTLPRPVTVLSTHSSWLMSSLVMGCGGLLSGAGSVAADLQVALWQAVQARNLARAQAINERLYPLQQAFYAPPFLDMHNRMKEALVLLGRMERAVVRPPWSRSAGPKSSGSERRSRRPGSPRQVRLTSLPEQPARKAETSSLLVGPPTPSREQARASPDRPPSRQRIRQAEMPRRPGPLSEKCFARASVDCPRRVLEGIISSKLMARAASKFVSSRSYLRSARARRHLQRRSSPNRSWR